MATPRRGGRTLLDGNRAPASLPGCGHAHLVRERKRSGWPDAGQPAGGRRLAPSSGENGRPQSRSQGLQRTGHRPVGDPEHGNRTTLAHEARFLHSTCSERYYAQVTVCVAVFWSLGLPLSGPERFVFWQRGRGLADRILCAVAGGGSGQARTRRRSRVLSNVGHVVPFLDKRRIARRAGSRWCREVVRDKFGWTAAANAAPARSRRHPRHG